MDFDKLDTYSPAQSDARGGSGNAGFSGDGLGSILCVGEGCCPLNNKNGTYWDPNTQQCIKTSVTAFTLMSETPCEKNAKVTRQVYPYEPAELTKYTKI